MRDLKADVSNQIAIAEFRFEDAAGGNFRVFFRRQLGWASLAQFAVMLLFVAFGVWFGFGFFKAIAFPALASRSAASTRPARGQPVCCFPFVLAFIGVWLSFPLRGLRAHWRATMGREEWSFGSSCVKPFSSPFRELPSLPTSDDLRAGLSLLGQYWVLGITSGAQQLLIGPFKTPELARDFERELRRRKPAWFGPTTAPADAPTPATAHPAPYALPEAIPDEPAAPIRDFQLLPVPGGFDLVVRRDKPTQRLGGGGRGRGGRRGGAGFLMLWLCGWLLGEIMVSRALAIHFFGVAPPGPRHGKEPPVVFLCAWLTFWTFGGIMAMRQLALQFRRTERWEFRPGAVIARPSRAFPRTRTLATDGPAHAHLLESPDGASIELTAAGVALRLGPIPDPAVARDLAAELRRYRPDWTWAAPQSQNTIDN